MNKKMKGRAKRVVDPNKPPSGFAKPGPVSDELRSFLKLGKDELIARTEVTKKITQYCKEHNLQKEEDKRTIHVDAPLRKLLRLSKGDELTFFNLQKYMKIHYPNKDGEYVHA
jgi:chromatin remodeling complex protein RSC6